MITQLIATGYINQGGGSPCSRHTNTNWTDINNQEVHGRILQGVLHQRHLQEGARRLRVDRRTGQEECRVHQGDGGGQLNPQGRDSMQLKFVMNVITNSHLLEI